MSAAPTDLDEPATTTMRALVKDRDAPGLSLDPARPLPTGRHGVAGEPGPGEALIRVRKAGICGTDRHIYEWDEWSRKRIPVGIVTGHEFMGTIAKLGAGVERLRVGQRVTAEGHILTGRDLAALTGEAHVSSRMEVIGIDRDGCFAEWLIVPAENVWALPDAISDRHASIMDPLGNAVHTVMAAGVSAQNVLVSGVGVIGLMAVTVARAAGAHRVFAVDVDERRIALARELGADEVYDAGDGAGAWVGDLRRATGGEGVDRLLEMSGFESAIASGFKALRSGGVAALLGTPSKPITFDIAEHVIFKGARVVGVTGRRMYETWTQMERLMLGGGLDLDSIITHELPVEDYEHGFELMRRGEAIKVLLDFAAPPAGA